MQVIYEFHLMYNYLGMVIFILNHASLTEVLFNNHCCQCILSFCVIGIPRPVSTSSFATTVAVTPSTTSECMYVYMLHVYNHFQYEI